MARIRSIKPEFWTNARVMECSTNARLLFIGMWNFADDLGRLALAPKTIKAQIFPSDDISFDTVLGMIQELSNNGLLLIYSVDNKEYLQITGWQHQRIDKPQPGKHPSPINGYSKNIQGMVATDSILSDLPDPIPSSPRDDLQKRTGNFQQAVVRAFADGNSPNLPETSRCGLWLTQGYQEDICLAVIAEIIRKRPSITTLNYFDNAIKEAHASKAPPRQPVVMKAEEVDWDTTLKTFKQTGHWSRWAGPDLDSPACRAPPEMLAKYGLVVNPGDIERHPAPPVRRMNS
jgi:hypothetical protein